MTGQVTITATEFREKSGAWIDAAAKGPVFITKHERPSRVLLDIDEYERLKSLDSRKAFSVSDMPEDHKQAIRDADYGPVDPELEKLMDE